MTEIRADTISNAETVEELHWIAMDLLEQRNTALAKLDDALKRARLEVAHGVRWVEKYELLEAENQRLRDGRDAILDMAEILEDQGVTEMATEIRARLDGAE